MYLHIPSFLRVNSCVLHGSCYCFLGSYDGYNYINLLHIVMVKLASPKISEATTLVKVMFLSVDLCEDLPTIAM